MDAAEAKRQLDRLTREQEQLRQQAEALAKQMQGQSGGGQGSQRASGGESQQMREVAEQMRRAAGDLQRQDPQQASSRGSQAGEQLRGLEQRMQSQRPEERRRAMGDAQLEAQQLAEAERRIGHEASQTTPGAGGEDARRRLAAEQDRLAERTERLGEAVRQLAGSGEDAAERQAMSEAGRELGKQRLAERMRESAQALRSGQGMDPKRQAEPADLARALDRVAERLDAATGARDGEAARLSEQLARAQELRDRLSQLQRSMEELSKDGQAGAGSVPRLQRDVDDQLREAQQLTEAMRRDNPDMEKGGTTPEQWSRSVSAPGTEAFKQDFAKWESLKKNLLVALEQTETQLTDQLRARETRERLNAGRHDGVADSYRDLVDRYYQSLASPRQPVRR
jgi:DNA repair exonuclease SbcCD ATPase subunit